MRSLSKKVCTAAMVLVVPVAVVAVAAVAAAKPQTTIATAASSDARVVLVATKTGNGSAPTARVTATTYERANGRWNRLRTVRVAGTYFWNVVSAPHALCRLDLTTARTATVKPRVIVQLLVTPSIGCGKSQAVVLPLD